MQLSFREPWTKRTILLFIIYNLIHFVISITNLSNEVWIVNWESSRQIAEGTPMYLQENYIPRLDRFFRMPPDHFPVYFYLMAGIILIFGANEIIARTIMWLFVVATSILMVKLIQPKREGELVLIISLFYLNPVLWIVNWIGKFDQIALFFMVLGLYFWSQSKMLLSGSALGIGVMVKFFPVFGGFAIGLQLVKEHRIRDLTLFSLGSLSTSATVFGYFWFKYSDKFSEVINYQLNRETASLSVWYHLFSGVDPIFTLIGQIVAILVYLVIFFRFLPTSINNVYITAIIFNSIYLLGTHQYYSSYTLYMFVLMIPLIVLSIELEQKANFVLGLLIIPIYFAGTTLCDGRCYPENQALGFIGVLGILFVYFSTLMAIFYSLRSLHLDKKVRAEAFT